MKDSLLNRLKKGLGKTRKTLTTPLSELLSGNKVTEDQLLQIEELLLTADIGYELVDEIIETLRDSDSNKNGDKPQDVLKNLLVDKLYYSSDIDTAPASPPEVFFFVGVNGSGKTTTVGKLASYLRSQGKSVILAACDTFRDAAIDQLMIWGERSGFKVVKHKQGADPSAVVFDAIKSAKANKIDYVLVDTAGRLHTKHNLMRELEKMVRITAREVEGAPHATFLVLDANTGQNGIIQAEEFLSSVDVDSIIVTKLDGTARGGFVFGIKAKTGLPVKYIGIGEQVDDIVEFNAENFVDALLLE